VVAGVAGVVIISSHTVAQLCTSYDYGIRKRGEGGRYTTIHRVIIWYIIYHFTRGETTTCVVVEGARMVGQQYYIHHMQVTDEV
jgi:hypothetical protein